MTFAAINVELEREGREVVEEGGEGEWGQSSRACRTEEDARDGNKVRSVRCIRLDALHTAACWLGKQCSDQKIKMKRKRKWTNDIVLTMESVLQDRGAS